MKLTPHFTLAELCVSAKAASQGVPNVCPPSLITNMLHLARNMEALRELYKLPINVLSGYRSRKVNTLVGGSETSGHMQGLACDFTCSRYGTLYMQALTIAASKVPFDQLILEPTWIHVGFAAPGKKPRGQVLTKLVGDSTYYQGLHLKRP